MRRAVLAGVETIDHGDGGTREVFELMAERGVALCPTLAAGDATAQYAGWKKGQQPEPARITAKRASFKAALDAGVTILNGSDVGVFAHGDNARELALMVEYGMPADAAVRSFVLTEDVDSEYGPMFFINGEFWPINTPISGALGALEVWEVQNGSPGDHPFHLHGMRFRVLSRAGEIEPRLGWKDTVNILGGQAVRFAVRYEAEGRWMYHCQIPEHAERGMMGELEVAAP